MCDSVQITLESGAVPAAENVEVGAPLTDGQESIYILSRLAGREPVYNMPFAFRLRGALDLEALGAATRAVAQRHHALRANVLETANGFRQVVRTNVETAVELHDLRACPGDLEKILLERSREPFDLERASPLRVDLYEIAENDHVLLLCLHHVFGDLLSVRAILDEIGIAYGARIRGQSPDFPEVPLQFDEYARRQDFTATRADAVNFWRARLAACPTEFEIPPDKGRPRLPTFQGQIHRFEIPAPVANGIKELARASKCSVYAAYLAAFQTLILRYTGARLFTVATPFSARREAELDATVGYLVNLLPLPCAPNPEGTFRETLSEVRKLTIEAFSNDSVSLRSILQRVGVSVDNPKNPLSRIVFQYVSESPTLHLEGLECSRIDIHTGTSKFDFDLTIVERDGATRAEIEYDTDLFEASTIDSIANHFVALLKSICANPDERIGRLDWLTAEDRQLLARVNDTAVEYPRGATVAHLFETQAAANPTKEALLFGDRRVTYAQLNARANIWAAALRERGVQPAETVGVCMNRSPELIVALLAILKVGAAFVPVDAKYPRPRIEYLIRDSGIRLLITDAKNEAVAVGVKTTRWEELEHSSSTSEICAPVSSESAAYLMYTSGSTGEPKAVCVPNRAIVRLVKNNDFMAIRPDDVFLLFAPVSFDASTLEVWGALLNGATLAIYEPEFESLDQFARIVQRHGVTNLWLTSGLFSAVVDQEIEALRGVRQLLVGGDVVSPAHVRRVYDAFPYIKVINGYGPTENTTFTCCYAIPRDWPPNAAIPIGKPIRNTSIHVLDPQMQPVPPGVPGELYCGGDGLALGYWNKPELTARTFVPNPFDFGASKLYRTGDKVRLRRDGIVEFLGRWDDQVKVRGFRIELGEIETALREVQGARDAAAAIETDAANGKRLLGFIVSKTGVRIEANLAHARVRELLPEHARPSRILIIDELPLGPNGKVDRKALLELARKTPEEDRIEEAALDPTESAIARVWAAVLDRPKIRADDNFFHIGGDSLRAMQAILQINRALNCDLTLSQIFEAPTVRGMASIVTKSRQTASRPQPGPIRRRGARLLPDAEANPLSNHLLLKEK